MSPTRGPAYLRLVSAARITASLRAATLSSLLVGLGLGATGHGKLTSALVVTGAKGGPGRCGCIRESGIVVVIGFRGRRHRIKIGHSGRFSTSLPAGQYHAVGGILTVAIGSSP
jgi:hypothetical protein